jgi:hypothetical protein
MSTPDWWGNWRPSLPAHTGDLQPTDLIECTMMSGGVPTNTVITGQQIIDAAQGGGGSTSWGNIGGTLSNQTDLQTALNGKQATLVSGTNIKTVNGNSLVGSGNVNIGPRLIGWSGILGTPTTGTAVGICHSILIPANTLGTNNILQLVFRMYRQSGNAGQLYGRIYFNTTNSLTGATLISSIFTMNGGGVQFIGYCERNYSYDGTSLRTIAATTFSEYTTGTIQTTAFNRTVNQYILFTMQAQNLADTGNVDLVKVFAYV